MMEEIKGKSQFSESLCLICHAEKMHSKKEGVISGLRAFVKEVAMLHFSIEDFIQMFKITRTIIFCNQCGAIFREAEAGTKWKLVKISDKNNSIWQKYGEKAFSDREWINIGNGGISDKEQQDVEIKFWMERINSGAVRVKVIRGEVPVILQKDEEPLCVLPSIFLYETRAVSVSRGGYGGASFRVAKGVSVRLGQFGSRSESHPEMRNIDQGTLVVTNKRFIYCGRIKTVQTDLNKIVEIDPFDDGIGLHKENREKTQYFTWTNMDSLERVCSTGSESLAKKELSRINEMGIDRNGEIELNDQGRKGFIPLTGEILKSIIEGAIKNI